MMDVNWIGIANLGEKRVLDALALALNGRTIPEIAKETGIPMSSLYSIRKNGPFAHQDKNKASK